MRPVALALRDALTRPGLPFDLAVSLLLALVTLASRWPYRARMLYNWDAVQFALALREFDIAKHQPHPPGYVLYVGLGRLVNATLADPTLAYVTLAIPITLAATTAALAAFYFLGGREREVPVVVATPDGALATWKRFF